MTAMIREETTSPAPKATLKRWVMILIMIIVQISILTSTIDTKGPLLNLLSVQSLRNSAELFFFMMMAHRNGDMTRKDDDEAQQVPFHSRQTFPNQRMHIGKI